MKSRTGLSLLPEATVWTREEAGLSPVHSASREASRSRSLQTHGGKRLTNSPRDGGGGQGPRHLGPIPGPKQACTFSTDKDEKGNSRL